MIKREEEQMITVLSKQKRCSSLCSNHSYRLAVWRVGRRQQPTSSGGRPDRRRTDRDRTRRGRHDRGPRARRLDRRRAVAPRDDGRPSEGPPLPLDRRTLPSLTGVTTDHIPQSREIDKTSIEFHPLIQLVKSCTESRQATLHIKHHTQHQLLHRRPH